MELYLRNIQRLIVSYIFITAFALSLIGGNEAQNSDCSTVFCLEPLVYQGYMDLFQSHDDAAKRTFNQSIRRAIATRDTSQWIHGLVGLSTYFSEKGLLDSAILISDSSVILAQSKKLYPFFIFAKDHEANLIAQKGDKEKALELLSDLLSEAYRLDDAQLIAKCLTSSGFIFLGRGRYEEAYTSYAQALEELKNLEEDAFLLKSKALLGQGIVFSDAKKYNQSLEKYKEALVYVERSNHPESPTLRLSLLRLIGQYFIENGQLSRADSVLQFAIDEIKKLTLNSTYLGLINRYSEVKYGLGKYNEALDLLEIVGDSRLLQSREYFVSYHHFQKGKVLLKLGRTDESIISFKIAHNTLGKQTMVYAENLNYLSLAYYQSGQKDSAYHYLTSYASFKDTINAQTIYNHIQRIENQFENSGSSNPINDNKVYTANQSKWRNTLLLTFLLLGMGAFYWSFYHFRKRTDIESPFINIPNERVVSGPEIVDEFWEAVQEVLEKHLEDPDFNAALFAKEMFMSRMQLHRQLKKRTQLSTSIFIRNERIKKSLPLIRQSDKTIAQIAYDVGFADHSFFSKSFKDIMHLTPSQYREEQIVE